MRGAVHHALQSFAEMAIATGGAETAPARRGKELVPQRLLVLTRDYQPQRKDDCGDEERDDDGTLLAPHDPHHSAFPSSSCMRRSLAPGEPSRRYARTISSRNGRSTRHFASSMGSSTDRKSDWPRALDWLLMTVTPGGGRRSPSCTAESIR